MGLKWWFFDGFLGISRLDTELPVMIFGLELEAFFRIERVHENYYYINQEKVCLIKIDKFYMEFRLQNLNNE